MSERAASDEDGFFLLEAIIIALLTALVAGGIFTIYQATRLSRQDGAREAGIFLAQSQLAYLEWQADHGGITPGAVPWQGEPGDLTLNDLQYEVNTMVTESSSAVPSPVYNVDVSVSWVGTGRNGQLSLHRFVGSHQLSELTPVADE